MAEKTGHWGVAEDHVLSFSAISHCSIWEEEKDKIFSPSSFLLKRVSWLGSYPRGLRITVPSVVGGRWQLRWRASHQPLSVKSHLLLRGKGKAWKKPPTLEAAVTPKLQDESRHRGHWKNSLHPSVLRAPFSSTTTEVSIPSCTMTSFFHLKQLTVASRKISQIAKFSFRKQAFLGRETNPF